MSAFRLPKSNEEEVQVRRNTIRLATLKASEIPYETVVLRNGTPSMPRSISGSWEWKCSIGRRCCSPLSQCCSQRCHFSMSKLICSHCRMKWVLKCVQKSLEFEWNAARSLGRSCTQFMSAWLNNQRTCDPVEISPSMVTRRTFPSPSSAASIMPSELTPAQCARFEIGNEHDGLTCHFISRVVFLQTCTDCPSLFRTHRQLIRRINGQHSGDLQP